MSDIITMLKADHKKVKALFEELESTTARAGKKRIELLSTVESELRIHMEIEEQRFYPAVKAGADKEGKELTNEAYAEHEAALSVLAKIKSLETSDEMWKANLMVFKENVEHHIKEEEGELFKIAKDVVAKEDLVAMGEEYAAMKAKSAGDQAKPQPRPAV